MQIIGGRFRGHKIAAPKSSNTRPTSSRLREALFNIVQGYIEGALFLDLYAGSGAMGLEALSRGAKKATFVDNNREALRSIQANAKQLHVESETNILNGDVFRMLEKLERNLPFDIIYADAPYTEREAPSIKLLEFIDQSALLNDQGMLFIEDILKEHSPLQLTNLHLVSVRNAGPAYLHQYQKRLP